MIYISIERVSPFGHRRITGCSAPHRRLSQPCHVLHRLFKPRHPPFALNNHSLRRNVEVISFFHFLFALVDFSEYATALVAMICYLRGSQMFFKLRSINETPRRGGTNNPMRSAVAPIPMDCFAYSYIASSVYASPPPPSRPQMCSRDTEKTKRPLVFEPEGGF